VCGGSISVPLRNKQQSHRGRVLHTACISVRATVQVLWLGIKRNAADVVPVTAARIE